VLLAAPASVGDRVADQPSAHDADNEETECELDRLREHAVNNGDDEAGEGAEHDGARGRTAGHTR